MAKNDYIEFDGVVQKILPGGKFNVLIVQNNSTHLVEGHLSGKMRINKININVGDKVKIEVSIYDNTKGRVTYRIK